MAIELQFLGGAGTVTGSKYLLKHNGQKILVDCGLFQGVKHLRMKNWEKFSIPPDQIDAVLLTHAHIDHSGYLPRLVKEGFKGPIYSTEATRDVCQILLPDAGYLQEEEANYLNKRGRSKHKPALPLFTQKDAEDCLEQFVPVDFEKEVQLKSGVRFQFRYAGHILGASSIVVTMADRKIAFSGDLGRQNDDLFFPPKPLPEVDYLITESTYGYKTHAVTNPLDELEDIVNSTYKNKGVVIIAAFAVGRAQAIMHYLSELKKQKRIADVPMYLNSPMATDFSKSFCHYQKLHKLSTEQCNQMSQAFHFVKSPEDSKALNEKSGPMVIISASGMLTGGRVLHHLKAFASDSKNAIVLAGYQSAGTRGSALQNGAEELKIHGEYVPIKAKVYVLDNMSAHADYKEILTWLKNSNIHPQKTFITHGEALASDELRRRIEENFGWDCIIPAQDEIFKL